MDTDQLLTHARSRFNHEAARRLLREKYQARMLFAHAGGMWRADPNLIMLLQSCPSEDSVVILDVYETPVRIDPRELLHLARQHWQEQMNAWLIEHEKIGNLR